MIIVKLLVLLYCARFVQGHRSGYCEICQNHTLCKYTVVEPSAACRGYDKNALLTDGDIVEIINRINARRNLVATGRLNRFPSAGNMRKVRWSTELANFGQRWANQCHTSVRPNQEDECRDLVGMHVGQNIASVLGPTPGLNVKSFIDMWFMLKLHYTGSIMYYNQTRDERTKYFTQLIWADTEYVGCGKVKFYNQELNTVVERLICNFAPKGNNHGKPVYALGYPATQCADFLEPDKEFPGLCKQAGEAVSATESIEGTSISSLLRIFDLSNNSMKQELDPNNFKQISLNRSEINDQRNQKTRHVYLNNSSGTNLLKRDSFHMQSPLNPMIDAEHYKIHQFTPERGHSRMYHGYQSTKPQEAMQNYQSAQTISEQDFRRYDLTTTAYSFSSNDHDMVIAPNGRRIIQNDYLPGCQHCTRRGKAHDNMNCCTTHCVTNQCTRGQSHSCNSCLNTQSCNSCLQPPLPPAPPSHDMCPCNTQTTCSTPCAPLPCDFNVKCPVCPSHSCPQSVPSPCAKRRAQGDAQDTSKTTHFNYYDLFPNIGMRSGEEISSQQKHLDNQDIEDSLHNKARESEISNQVKDIAGNLQMTFRRPQDSYGIFSSSERKRRDFEDQMTFKPFWQMDEFNYKRPSELKSLKYTTLGNKRNKKTRRTTSYAKLPTESITIKSEDQIIHDAHHSDQTTEKYLSFKELMYLRKLSTEEAFDYEARRIGDAYDALRRAPTTKATTKKPVATTTTKKPVAATTTKKPVAATTTKKPAVTTKASATTATTKKAVTTTTQVTTPTTTLTANTPFIRMKHCTRKLTCTWTAMMMTRPDGLPILPGDGGGGIIDFGSRTPPGYVDGCTRTSTCTREFMNRNKQAATTPGDSDGSKEEGEDDGQEGDEDYCERRSLNVQRRNLDDTEKILSLEFHDTLTEISPSSTEISHVTSRNIADSETSQNKHGDCICYENFTRVKRGESSKYEQMFNKDCNSMKSNQNIKNQDGSEKLYNSVMNNISKNIYNSPSQCSCSGTTPIHKHFCLLTLLNYNLVLWYYVIFTTIF